MRGRRDAWWEQRPERMASLVTLRQPRHSSQPRFPPSNAQSNGRLAVVYVRGPLICTYESHRVSTYLSVRHVGQPWPFHPAKNRLNSEPFRSIQTSLLHQESLPETDLCRNHGHSVTLQLCIVYRGSLEAPIGLGIRCRNGGMCWVGHNNRENANEKRGGEWCDQAASIATHDDPMVLTYQAQITSPTKISKWKPWIYAP